MADKTPALQTLTPEQVQAQLAAAAQSGQQLQPQFPAAPKSAPTAPIMPVVAQEPAEIVPEHTDPLAVLRQAVSGIPNWLTTPAGQPVLAQPKSATAAEILAAQIKSDLEALPEVQQEAKQAANQVIQPLRAEAVGKLALDNIEKMRQDADQRMKEMRADTERRLSEIDSEVRQQSLADIMQRGSFGSKLGAVLALSLGAAGAALTGQPNAAIAYFDKLVDQQAAKDKLNHERKEALRRAVYEQGKLELDKLAQATDSAYKKDAISLQTRELNQKLAEAHNAALQAAAENSARAQMLSGRRELTDEEFASLSSGEREAVVTLDDGRRFYTTNKDAANDLRKYMVDVGGAMNSLRELRKLINEGNRIDPRDTKQAAVLTQTIIGALRIPLTGPGVLTDTERAQLLQVIGKFDPTSLRFIERTKVDTLLKDLEYRMQYNARLAGIRAPLVKEQVYKIGDRLVGENDIISAYKKRAPNLSDEKIKALIQRQHTPL